VTLLGSKFSRSSLPERRAVARAVIEPIITGLRDRKVAGTYDRLAPGDDGRIHTFLSPDTASFRFSSSDSPLYVHSTNLQNLEKKVSKLDPLYRARDIIIPTDGMVLLAGDYSGAEAIGVAAYSRDWDYLDKLLAGVDTHTELAIRIWGECDPLKRDIAKTIKYACVPLNTRILTLTGWKDYSELAIGEAVVGFDPQTETLVADRVTAVNAYAEAPLYRYAIKGWSAVCTEDHRWIGRYWPPSSNAYRRSPTHLRTEPIRTGRGGFNLIVSAPYVGGQGLAHKPTSELWHVSPQDVLSMTPRERHAFVLGIVSAEGSGQRYGTALAQSKKKWFEAYLLALFLEGYGTRVRRTDVEDCFSLYGAKPTIGCTKMTKTYVGTAPVWCPTTESGYWVMRQGDQISLTGNSSYVAKVPTVTTALNKEADRLGRYFTQEEVHSYLQALYTLHPLQRWWQEVRDELSRTNGAMRNCFGYRRTFHDPNPDNRLKDACSFLPQSTVAWLMNRAIALIFQRIDRPNVRELLHQIHDELLFQCREDEIPFIVKTANEILELRFTIHGRELYIPVEWKWGHSWGSMQVIKPESL